MKIQLISDVHFEFFEDPKLFNNDHNADVLIIAGDLAVGFDAVWSALKRFGDIYPQVIYTSGNHEYYKQDMYQFNQYLNRFSKGTNIIYLNPGMIKIKDVTFIGATLWTNFRKDRIAKMACARNISDFRLIRGFDTDACDLLHTEHAKYIFDAYAAVEGKKVIVTHFLPAVECIAPEFRGTDLLNYYFANDYGDQIAGMKDTTWLFGHTHSVMDFMLGDTRMIANPYGYNRNPNYKEMIIQL